MALNQGSKKGTVLLLSVCLFAAGASANVFSIRGQQQDVNVESGEMSASLLSSEGPWDYRWIQEQDEGGMSLPPSPGPGPRPTRPPRPQQPPTSAPRTPPTPAPVPPPTRRPRAPPTPAPVNPPTPAPVTSTAPTGECVLELGIECTLDNGEPCEDYTPVLESCSGRPTIIGFRYTGGGCDQSDNDQEGTDAFSCENFGDGPPTTAGTPSYIVATDALEMGSVYHQEWVDVGAFFNVTVGPSQEGNEIFLNIYSTQDQSQSNLLQFVKFDGSCSSPLNLGDQFGAVEVTSWQNEDQGYVSAFTGLDIQASISIPGDEGSFLTLRTLVVETSFAGTIDLSRFVSGQVVPTGDASVTIPIPTNIDITEPQTFSFALSLSGTAQSGELCTGSLERTYTIGGPSARKLMS